MEKISSIALHESQAMLHCATKASLYNVEMTLANRIKTARERLRPKVTQAKVAAHFGISNQAVSGWERGSSAPEYSRIADLAVFLKVPCNWLLKGGGNPPPPDSIEVTIEDLDPSERAIVNATINAIRSERHKVA